MTNRSSPFLYFAYGSNLDEERLHIHCPSAGFVGIAQLANYQLAFSIESTNTWHGGVADIRPMPQEVVWGALWIIDEEHSDPLDRQEGIFRNPPAYERLLVDVKTPADDRVRCRSYQVVNPDSHTHLPSPAYLETILRGARAIGLPANYIRELEAIDTNGYEGASAH